MVVLDSVRGREVAAAAERGGGVFGEEEGGVGGGGGGDEEVAGGGFVCQFDERGGCGGCGEEVGGGVCLFEGVVWRLSAGWRARGKVLTVRVCTCPCLDGVTIYCWAAGYTGSS